MRPNGPLLAECCAIAMFWDLRLLGKVAFSLEEYDAAVFFNFSTGAGVAGGLAIYIVLVFRKPGSRRTRFSVVSARQQKR